MKRGTIWLCDFGYPRGHEPGFQRPAVLVSDDEINRRALPIVLPVTRTRRGYATHVELEKALPVTSYVQCELIRAVSGDRLLRKVGDVDPVDMLRIAKILSRILDI